MTAALLSLLTTWALGLGAVLCTRPRLPLVAQAAAGALLGPPLATWWMFVLQAMGWPLGDSLAWAATGTAGLLLALGVFRSRGVDRSEAALDRAGVFAVLSLAAISLVEGILRLLAIPAPRGDGLTHFGYKARVLGELGSLLPWMADPRIHTLHPDYPPHQPYLMWMGHGFAGEVDHLAALAPVVLLAPALIAWLGLRALEHGRSAGILCAALILLCPGLFQFAMAGYADPWVMALLALVGTTLFGKRGLGIAILAAGLLPWVKLEGIVHLVLLALFGLIFAQRPRKLLLRGGLIAGAMAATWPITLLQSSKLGKVREHALAADQGEYLRELIHEFSEPLIDPSKGFLLVAPPAILALLMAAWRPSTKEQRTTSFFALSLCLGYPALSWLRHTAVLGRDTDVPERLTGHWMPLALFVLATTLATSWSARAAKRPSP